MIYECLQCQAPQLPGDVACPHCGAQFAGPVPEDATLEEEPIPEAAPAPDLSQATPPMPPPLIPPPLPSSPTLTTTTYTPYSEPSATKTSVPPLLAVGAVVGLLAIIGLVYLIINAGQTAVSSAPAPPPPPVITQPIPGLQPVSTRTMTGGSPGTAPAGDAAAQAAPVGRWMTPTFDFYEFDKDGTGSRGSVNDGKAPASFAWTVVKNQLILSTAKGGSATEKVPFSYGPDGNTLYLRGTDGQYAQYTRTPQ